MSDLLNGLYEDYNSDELYINNLENKLKEAKKLAYFKYQAYLSDLDLNNLELEDLNKLKDIFFSINGYCEEYTQLSKIIELNQPYTFKAISKMDYLSPEQRASLNSILERYKGSQLITSNGLWFNLKLTKENEERVIKDLYENGYLLNYYRISCKNCHVVSICLSEDEINDLKCNEEIIEKIDNHEKNKIQIPEQELDELYDKFYDITENPTHRIHQSESGESIFYCYDCGGETIYKNSTELQFGATRKYKVVGKDMLEKINSKFEKDSD